MHGVTGASLVLCRSKLDSSICMPAPPQGEERQRQRVTSLSPRFGWTTGHTHPCIPLIGSLLHNQVKTDSVRTLPHGPPNQALPSSISA